MDTQYKKGILPMCVLSVLKEEDSYGYKLSSVISKEIDVSEGTIYPLLKRMKKENLVSTYLKESDSGPPRKYYKITENGFKRYYELIEEWKEFNSRVFKLIEED
ncbi:MAG: PadR family transcriptional regulator [Bacillota bacterium]|nr:PadR family transcriptional regulator [Bacillota bacterium]